MKKIRRIPGAVAMTAAIANILATVAAAEPAGVLGRQVRLDSLGDDFEFADWAWDAEKGRDTGERWTGSYRGAPRLLQRVEPPPGGRPGSRGALSIRTEGDRDAHPNQDDLVHTHFSRRLGRPLTRADQPVFLVRIWMPPFEEWTPGYANLGFRHEARSDEMIGERNPVGYYYPSIWLRLVTPEQDPARAGPRWYVRIGTGVAPDEDAGPIPRAGWWTLALSFDSDGIGRYYARPGVEPPEEKDKIWNTTRFGTPHGENPCMDTVAYGFFSLGYPADARLTPPFVIDDYEIWIQGPEPER